MARVGDEPAAGGKGGCRRMRHNRALVSVVAYSKVVIVPHMRIRDAAGFLGVSDDTVRRWIDNGQLGSTNDEVGRMVVDGYELAQFVRRQASTAPNPLGIASSARNRFVGLVTDIRADKVMAQVELQCGPFRVVSLMSSEAVRELKLELGSVAVAVVKSTTVIVETVEGES